MPAYFSDRQRGPRPRTNETIEPSVWGGIYAIVSALLSNGSFGHSFPENCPDGYGVIGHDSRALELMLKAQHPDMPYPLPLNETPDTLAILDFLEFVAASIGKPVEGSFHSFFRHHHLSFDREAGLREFVDAIDSKIVAPFQQGHRGSPVPPQWPCRSGFDPMQIPAYQPVVARLSRVAREPPRDSGLIEMDEYAFPELLDCGQPIGVTGNRLAAPPDLVFFLH